MQIKQTGSTKKYYLSYTVLFLILLPLVFLCFIKNKFSFIWLPDGLAYFSGMKELGSMPLFHSGFTFQRGLGRGYQELESIVAIFNPFLLLTRIWPDDKFEILYTFRILTGFYLAGFSFSVFARKFVHSIFPTLGGAMTYAFSGFMLLYGVRHPQFAEILVFLLPLLLLGIEKIFRGESFLALVPVVFLFSLEGFYYLYIATILAGIFYLVRFFTMDELQGKRSIRLFVRLTGQVIAAYGLGIWMSLFSCLPSLLLYSKGGRIGKPLVNSFFHYNSTYYKNLLLNYFSAAKQVHVFPAIAYPALFALFFKKHRKNKRTIRWLWILGTLFSCLPLFAYLCSVFSNTTNRWSIGYTLVVAMAITAFLEDVPGFSLRRCLICILGFTFYCSVCFTFSQVKICCSRIVFLR